MYGMITSLVTVLWIAAYTLLANPAAGAVARQVRPGPRRLHRRLCLRRRSLGGGDLAARALDDRAQGGSADRHATNR